MKNPFHQLTAVEKSLAITWVAALVSTGPLGTRAVDADGNGFSDVWEQVYPGAASSADADLDGDGLSNRDESLTWCEPSDRGSAFRPVGFRLEGSELFFGWPAVPWLRYRVWRENFINMEVLRLVAAR